MSAQFLLDSLSFRGASVTVEAGVLYVAPRAILTDDDRAAIREHKPALLSLLSQSTLQSKVAAPDAVLETASQSPLEPVEVAPEPIQSTLAPPGPPPRDGATWDADKCVFRWRHWIMRTPASIALERAMLARQDSDLMALPEIYRNPATPQSTLAISSLDTMKNEQTLKTDKTPEANHVDSM